MRSCVSHAAAGGDHDHALVAAAGTTSSSTFGSRKRHPGRPPRVYKPSTVARDQAVEYLDSIGKNHEFLSPVGTDAISFNEIGIPASGVLTGQDCCKTQ